MRYELEKGISELNNFDIFVFMLKWQLSYNTLELYHILSMIFFKRIMTKVKLIDFTTHRENL